MGYPPGAVNLPRVDEALARDIVRIERGDLALRDELASLLRSGPGRAGQLASTAWIVDRLRRAALLVAHPSLGWACPGGHVEHGEHSRSAVLREVREETGLVLPDRAVSTRPFVVTCAEIPSGPSGPRHLHWSVGYRVELARTDAKLPADVGWFELDELPTRRPGDLAPVLRDLLDA